MSPVKEILNLTAHRPWPLPRGPWVMFMRWTRLSFLHWPVPAETLRALVPRGLEIDTFNGQGWLGIVPFRMEGTRPRFMPPVPGAADFHELNVRTYVRAPGSPPRPGVWFFSLDAASRPAVFAARAALNLPYFNAAMSVSRGARPEEWLYESRRTHRGAPAAAFTGSCRPAAGQGSPFHPAPGTLEHWLTERYCLYGRRRSGAIHRMDIHHPPWLLQEGEAEIGLNSLASAAGISLPDSPPLVHVARDQAVAAWLPQRAKL